MAHAALIYDEYLGRSGVEWSQPYGVWYFFDLWRSVDRPSGVLFGTTSRYSYYDRYANTWRPWFKAWCPSGVLGESIDLHSRPLTPYA